MSRIPMLLALLGLLPLAGPSLKAPNNKTDVVVSEEEAGKVTVKAPRPEVWYILPRADVTEAKRKPASRLIPRIKEATQREPF